MAPPTRLKTAVHTQFNKKTRIKELVHHSLDAPYQSFETFPQVVSGSFFQKLRPKVLHAFYTNPMPGGAV
jgi:hypothetical protein